MPRWTLRAGKQPGGGHVDERRIRHIGWRLAVVTGLTVSALLVVLGVAVYARAENALFQPLQNSVICRAQSEVARTLLGYGVNTPIQQSPACGTGNSPAPGQFDQQARGGSPEGLATRAPPGSGPGQEPGKQRWRLSFRSREGPTMAFARLVVARVDFTVPNPRPRRRWEGHTDRVCPTCHVYVSGSPTCFTRTPLQLQAIRDRFYRLCRPAFLKLRTTPTLTPSSRYS